MLNKLQIYRELLDQKNLLEKETATLREKILEEMAEASYLQIEDYEATAVKTPGAIHLDKEKILAEMSVAALAPYITIKPTTTLKVRYAPKVEKKSRQQIETLIKAGKR